MRTLKSVKAASFTNKLLDTLEKRHYMRQWNLEASTLTKLDFATKKAVIRFRKMRGARALQHFSKIASVLAFERTKTEQTTAFADLKRVKKAFGQLYKYKEDRLTTTNNKMHAKAFNGHNLLIKGFHSLLSVHKK